MYGRPGSGITNFLLIGEERCGSAIVESALNSHPQVVCHANLFHDDIEVRRDAYEDYFGRQACTVIPHWFSPECSAEHFLSQRIFDICNHGETAVGVKLSYAELERFALWDFVADCIRSGDFCVLHVERNPIACLTSRAQRRLFGLSELRASEPISRQVMERESRSVFLDLEELVDSCRQYAAARQRVRARFLDRMDVHYHELVAAYPHVLNSMQAFLRISVRDLKPGTRKLPRRAFPARIGNFETLQKNAPSDVLEFFNTHLV